MTLMDPIGDMFTRIRNGQMRSISTNTLKCLHLLLDLKILEVLKVRRDLSTVISLIIMKKDNNKVSLIVDLKYYEGTPVIREIKRISKARKKSLFTSGTAYLEFKMV